MKGIILLLAAIGQREAQPISLPAEVCAAIVRVTVEEGGVTAKGSGAFIEPGLVVTNWHVVCERRGDQVTLTWPERGDTTGTVLATNQACDLAVIEPAETPVGIAPLAVRDTRPEQGEPLAIAGYPGGQFPLRGMGGSMTGHSRDRYSSEWNFISLSAISVPGMSGGPILDSSHRLAGVLFGSDGETTTGASCVEVHQCIGPWCQRRQQSPAGSRRQIVTAPAKPSGRPPVVAGSQQPATQPSPQWATETELQALAGRVTALEGQAVVGPDQLDQALANAKADLQKALGGNITGAISDAAAQIKQDALQAVEVKAGEVVSATLSDKLAPLAEIAANVTNVNAKLGLPAAVANPWLAPLITGGSILSGLLGLGALIRGKLGGLGGAAVSTFQPASGSGDSSGY